MGDLFDRYGATSEGAKAPDLFDRYAASPSVSKPVGAAMVSPQNNPPAAAPPGSLAVPPKPAPEVARPWSELPGNILSSAGNALSGLYHAFTDPNTPANLGKIGDAVLPPSANPDMAGGAEGVLSNTATAPALADARAARVEETKPIRNALAEYADQRAGSPVRLRNTIITDPVGAALDASTILPIGGAMLPARAGALAGKAAAIVDPLTATGNVLKGAGKAGEVVGSNVLGMSTGAGPEAIRLAGRAGIEGGEKAKAFAENMRGDVPITDIVNRAKSAVGELRQDRAAAYKSGMIDVSKDKTVLDFGPIEDAVGKAGEVGSYKGVTVNRSAGETNGKIADIVNEWKALDPTEYHTPEGLDALKRTIGDLRDATEQGTPSRVAADRVYNAVKAQIEAQAPTYAKVMEGYSKASEGLKEATRTFSLGDRATGDTAARKLTSSLRNNVQTNFGERERLLNVLAEKDPALPSAIAGQSMNALAPRGLIGRGGLAAAAGTAIANPLHLLALPGFSPRIVGEVVYAGGKAIGKVDDVANALHITPQNLRMLEQGGFQADRSNALAAVQ